MADGLGTDLGSFGGLPVALPRLVAFLLLLPRVPYGGWSRDWSRLFFFFVFPMAGGLGTGLSWFGGFSVGLGAFSLQ